RITNIILAIALVISIGFFFYGLIQSIETARQAKLAKKEEQKAKLEKKRAENASLKLLKQTSDLMRKDTELRNSNANLTDALMQARRAKDLAAREAENAKRQEQIAKKQTAIANITSDSLKIKSEEANRNLVRANTLFYLALARSLEAKSENIENQQLAALIAMQGYNYHQKYQGNQYDPYVFRGLYYALTKLKGTNYNELKVPTANNKLFALAVSKKSETFYTSGNDGRVMVGDFLQMNSKPTPYKNAGYSNQVLALSKDERYLAVGNDSSTVEVIDLRSQEKPMVVRGHLGSITDIKFMPDNSGFVSVSSGGKLRFTKQHENKSYDLLSLPYSIKSIDISSDSQWIAAASVEGKLILVSTKDYSFREIASEAPSRILSVAFNPLRSNLLAYGMEVISQQKVVRGVVKMIDIETNKTKELSGHRAGIADLKFSPDGKLLASAGLDKKLQMWVVDHEEDLPIVMDNNNGNVWRIDFANGSDYLIGSCNNGEIRVWPTRVKMLAEQLCPLISRNITKEEWRTYIGNENEIKYEETCAKPND
ncbi:MAG: hypothetical protein ACKO13_13605, partial [Cytophagales bacterium]